MGARTGNESQLVDLGTAGIAGVVAALARRWRLVAVIAIGAAAAALAVSLLTPPVYESTCTFISSSQITGESGLSSLGALSSAASRLGVDLRNNPGDLSPLFPWMLENREIGRGILETSFKNSSGRSQRLLDVLVPAGPDSLRRLDKALTRLHRKVMNYSFDRKSGVTRVTAALEDPVLAAAVANAFVDGLDRYNQTVVAGKAGSVASFLEERLHDFEEQIRVEESALRDFRTENRGFQQSPSLALEEARLTRNLELAQQLYLNLRSQFEMVRMEEFKRLPRLTVIDAAHPPYRKARPRTLPVVAISGLLGLVAGAGWVLGSGQWRWYVSQQRAATPIPARQEA